MNFEQFFLEAERLNININFDNEESQRAILLNNEALFHLPFWQWLFLCLLKDRENQNLPNLVK